jgi:hypothetical protein
VHSGPPTLVSVSEAMMNAAMAMFEELMPRWNALKTSMR